MTPEQLDEARAREAKRLWDRADEQHPNVATIAARLAREGWEPVDPDLIEAREIWAKLETDCYEAHGLAGDIRKGARDNAAMARIALAAIKRGRELERGQ